MLLADVGGSRGVTKTLSEFRFDPELIKKIEAFLEQREALLKEQSADASGGEDKGNMFGISWSGMNLNVHHQKADAFLENTIVETAYGLQQLSTGLKDFTHDVNNRAADEQARNQALLNAIQNAHDVHDRDRSTHVPGQPSTEGDA